MKIFVTHSPKLGNAKAYLLREILVKAAQNAGHEIADVANAELVLIVGDDLPHNAQLNGKKVALLNAETAFHNPEAVIANAQQEAVDYVQPVGVAESAVESVANSGVKNVVAVTACPTGVAHTFMSAEAIEIYGKKQGWNIKVETRGQVGVGNLISPEEVAAADLVFVAADIDVDLSKFKGKPMYRTSTGLALKKTAQEFDKAFAEAKIYGGEKVSTSAEGSNSDEKKGVYKHLMTGVSHMLPLVVAGGLAIAMSFMFGIKAFEDANIAGGLPKALMDIGGGSAFHLMIAVFAGYVAFSIADRPGLAPGLIGGMLATTGGAGILGGIIAGFFAGYVVKFLNDNIKLSQTADKPLDIHLEVCSNRSIEKEMPMLKNTVS
ncbi:fructose-specific phosphotransferase system IIB component/fructose-specific phosphotransferase system IIC component, partial [Cricetibacter osteomyelitidis]